MTRAKSTWRIHGFALGVMALLFTALCGCGGSSAQKVLYALGLDPNVTIFAVSGLGGLTPTTSVSTGAGPVAMGFDPQHRFAYIVDSAGGIAPVGGVSQYVLDAKSGGLTVATFSSTNGTTLPSTPVATGTNPTAIAIDSTGTFVFVANQGSSSISVFLIDQVGGALTEVKQPPPGPTPVNCVPGNPNPCPLPTTFSPNALAITGKTLFAANAAAASISTYTFNFQVNQEGVVTGALTSAGTTPTPAGFNPSAMDMDSSGSFLFLADSAHSLVAVFSIASSGQLTAVGAPIATGPTPLNVWVHPSGKFLYTANQGSNNVSAFSFDSSSGAMNALSGSPFSVLPGNGPSYVATDTSGSLLFVANLNTNNISVFSIDSSGALTQVTGSPFASPVINPIALASIN